MDEVKKEEVDSSDNLGLDFSKEKSKDKSCKSDDH